MQMLHASHDGNKKTNTPMVKYARAFVVSLTEIYLLASARDYRSSISSFCAGLLQFHQQRNAIAIVV